MGSAIVWGLMLLLVTAAGCGVDAEKVTVTGGDGESQSLTEVVDQLIAVNQEQADQIKGLQEQVQVLQANLDAFKGEAATQVWVQNQAYATESWVTTTLDSYATDADVSDLSDQVDSLETDVEDLGQTKVGIIAEAMTLEVPSRYATIHEALKWLNGYVVSPEASVTIHIADGYYTYDQPIVVRHISGDRIRIIGNESNASAVTLRFNGTAGLYIDQGHCLGKLNGLTLQGDGTTRVDGVGVTDHSSLYAGPELVVENFANSGVYVGWNSTVIAPGITVQDNDSGFGIYYNSAVYAPRSVSTRNGNGYYLTGNSFLHAESAKAEDNLYNGMFAHLGSMAYANAMFSSDNGGYGFYALRGSIVEVSQTEEHVSGNGNGGYYPSYNSSPDPSYLYSAP